MAEFKSRYAGLGFYVDGNLRKFSNGRYVTVDVAEIEVLEKLTDAERVDTPAPEAPKTEAKPATEPKPKAPARKSSAK